MSAGDSRTLADRLYGQRRWSEALAAYEVWLAAEPDCAAALLGRGRTLMWLRRREEAAESFALAATIAPDDYAAHANLAVALRELGRHGEALERFERALALGPAEARLRREWLSTLMEVRGPEAAEGWLAAHAADPQEPMLLEMWGGCLARLGRFEAAWSAYDRALALAPDWPPALYGRGLADLTLGRFTPGWEGYEARWRVGMRNTAGGPPDLLAQRIERPEPAALAGADVVLLGEQGVGDMVMFASIIPDLLAVARRVSLVGEMRLARLFVSSFPQLHTSAAWSGARIVTLGSLGYAFRRTPESFPAAPYLRPSAAAREQARALLGPRVPGRRRIGLSWRGGAEITGRNRRSVDLAALMPLLSRPDVEFVSLQYGDHGEEIAAANRTLPRPIITPPAEAMADFDDLAGLTAEMDGVLSVQTALIHLSGALGVPCVVMVPKVPEWRYGAAGETMPWYGSVRLVRERAEGGLASVAPEAWQTLLRAIDERPSPLTAPP